MSIEDKRSDSGTADAVSAATKLFDRRIDELNYQIAVCKEKGQAVYVANLTSQRDGWVAHRRALSGLAQQPQEPGRQ